MRSLTIAILLAVTSTALADDHVWHYYNGHEYALTLTQDIWLHQEAEAVSLGAHLVTINDAAENAWVAQTFGHTYCLGYADNPVGDLVDIGYYFNPVSAAWEWISGQPVTYTNLYGSFPEGGSHAYIHGASHPSVGTWNAAYFITEAGATIPAFGVIETPEPSAFALLCAAAASCLMAWAWRGLYTR
jgi:hypothetical protein